jgi:hypothetical protein
LLVAATGCGSSASSTANQPTPSNRLTLDDVRHFAGYPVYSAGSVFEGKAITHIQRSLPPKPTQLVTPSEPTPVGSAPEPDLTTVTYGTCTPSNENGCPVPLSITSSSYCDRPIQGGSFIYKGARAAWISGGLVLWFRDSTVNIIAAMSDANAVEMRVADQLIALNADVVPDARTSASDDFGGVTASC